MKSVILAFIIAFGGVAFADGGCVDANGVDIDNNPEAFIPLIAAQKSCYEAATLANACAWGSSMDVTTAGTAYDVCATELATYKPSKKTRFQLYTMRQQCVDKYSNIQGTMYMSMDAFCQLEAIQWIIGIASPADEG